MGRYLRIKAFTFGFLFHTSSEIGETSYHLILDLDGVYSDVVKKIIMIMKICKQY